MTMRNPVCFPKPLKFDPGRKMNLGPASYAIVPVGGGPRMCPGKQFARLKILVFMVKKFKWKKIIADEKIVVDPLAIAAKGPPVRLSVDEA